MRRGASRYQRYAIYLLLPVLLGGVGWLAFQNQKRVSEENFSNQLQAIGDIKLMEIRRWASVWKTNANIVSSRSSLSQAFSRYVAGSPRAGMESTAALISEMRLVDKDLHTLGTSLFDSEGNLIITSDPDMEQEIREGNHVSDVEHTLLTNGTALSPLHLRAEERRPHRRAHFEVFAPVSILESGAERTIGVLAIAVDPREYLFPLIEKWPAPSKTAETLLLMREGNSVVYLNDLRFRKNTALRLHIPLKYRQRVSALAGKGVEGIVKGIDYRGMPVIASLRAIPEMNWYIEAKVDQEELYAPIRHWALFTIAAVFVLASLGIAAIHLIWTREEEAAQRENEVNLRRRAENEATAKGEFLANMSHEIRTPLNSILGFAETLDDDEISARRRKEAGRIILRNSRHLMDIVNDILDLSKIEAGKIEIERVPCNPLEAVRDIAEMMKQRASERGLVFEQEFLYPLPVQIVTDKVRLKQILLNLVSNAIKFTESGFVRMRAWVDTVEEKMSFEVQDSGRGISEAEIARIFEPFYQGDLPEEYRSKGSGLGLAISRRLAALLGGGLELTSVEGRGTTCRVTVATGRVGLVPFVHDDSWMKDSNELSVHEEASPSLVGRVLLMEDNRDTQRLISYLVEKTGAEIAVAENGRIGASMAAEGAFDLVIADMHMPEMNGLEAIRSIRDRGLRMPIVALSADAIKDRLQRCLELGCDDYFVKPFERAKLYALLKRYLRPGGAAKSVSKAADAEELEDIQREYADALPGRISAVRQCLLEGDLKQAREMAHKLASAALFGFPAVGDIARKLQNAAGSGESEYSWKLLEELEREALEREELEREEVNLESDMKE